MNLEQLISTDKICTEYQVEFTFIRSLHESGLIEVVTVEEKPYVHCDHLRNFEKMMRLHRDLHINIEGLEAVQQLLEQVNDLKNENRKLRNRLRLYEE